MGFKSFSASRKVRFATHGKRDRDMILLKDLNAEPMLSLQDRLRDRYDVDVTLEHIAAKAAAPGLKQARYGNGRMLFGRFYEFEHVSIAFAVSLRGGRDLGILKIDRIDEKSVVEIAREYNERAEAMRENKSGGDAQARAVQWMTIWLLSLLAWVALLLNDRLGLSVPGLGDGYAFGSAFVSNVGALKDNIDGYYAHADTPTGVSVPIRGFMMPVEEKPVVEDGEVTARRQLPVVLTGDHRYFDAHEALELLSDLEKKLQTPETIDGLEPE